MLKCDISKMAKYAVIYMPRIAYVAMWNSKGSAAAAAAALWDIGPFLYLQIRF